MIGKRRYDMRDGVFTNRKPRATRQEQPGLLAPDAT